MSDQNIFDNNDNKSDTPDYSDMLASIKNENGEQKYKNINEALKALANAQDYIPKLHSRIDALEAKQQGLEKSYEESLSIADRLDKILQEQRNQQEYLGSLQNKELDDPPPPPPEPKEAPTFNEEEMYKNFRGRMEEEEKANIRSNNINTVSQTVLSMYGEKSKEFLNSKLADLGMSMEALESIAAQSPKAALSLIGIKGTKQSNEIGSNFNTAGFKTYEDSQIKRNTKTLLGASSEDVTQEFRNAGEMVKQLKDQGIAMNDLTDPKNYFKLFKV